MSRPLRQLWNHFAAARRPGDEQSHLGASPPLLIKGGVPLDLCTPDDIYALFKNLCVDPNESREKHLRVYVEGMLSPHAEHTLLNAPPAPGQAVEEWLSGITHRRRFGVILNGAEQWNDELARRIHRIFSPLIGRHPPPFTSLELTLFVGDYGYTPFGIHIDDPYSDVVHFHLGPGSKRMTLFGASLFKELNGSSRRSFDFDNHITAGQNFEIEAGDVFALPAPYFHIGFTSDFSIGLAVAVERRTKSRAARLAAKDAVDSSAFAKTRQSEERVRDWIRSAKRRQRAVETSRGGLRYSPLARTDAAPLASRFRVHTHLPCELRRTKHALKLFARGHEIELTSHDAIEDLVARMTRGDWWTIAALQKKFAACIEADAVHEVASALWRLHALEAQPHDTRS